MMTEKGQKWAREKTTHLVSGKLKDTVPNRAEFWLLAIFDEIERRAKACWASCGHNFESACRAKALEDIKREFFSE